MPLRKMIRVERVLEVTSLTRGSLYSLIKAGDFPKPRQIGPRLNAWFEDEIEQWQATRPEGLRSAENEAPLLRAVPRSGQVPA